MRRVLSILLCMAMCAVLCACHAAPPEDTVHNHPGTTISQDIEPTFADTMPTTAPTEPTMPKELVSEVREDGLVYTPHTHHYRNSGRAWWAQIQFALDEDCYPGKTITYDVSTNFGFLWEYPDYSNSPVYKNLENNKYYGWMTNSLLGLEEALLKDGAIFVDAVIRADGIIVGYGIFEINGDGKGNFALMRSETVVFPMFHGKFQEVSEQYVLEKIAELKQTVTPFDWEEKEAEYVAYLNAANEALRREYFEERKPLDTSAIIQITSSQDVLEEDPAVAHMNVVKGYHFVANPIFSPNADWKTPYSYYLFGSGDYARITYSCDLEDKDLRPRYGQYDAKTNYGGFCSLAAFDGSPGEYLGPEATSKSAAYLAWIGLYDIPGIDPATIQKPDRIWIDVIVRDGDYIIGFAVYELVPWEDYYEGYLIVNAYDESYKLIDGRFQNIAEEFVNQRIEAYHQYAESNP